MRWGVRELMIKDHKTLNLVLYKRKWSGKSGAAKVNATDLLVGYKKKNTAKMKLSVLSTLYIVLSEAFLSFKWC